MEEALDEQPDEMKQIQPFKFYASNLGATYKIIETRWVQFCLLGGLLYFYHLLFCMAGVNMFAS
jgi:hypothetical protein